MATCPIVTRTALVLAIAAPLNRVEIPANIQVVAKIIGYFHRYYLSANIKCVSDVY